MFKIMESITLCTIGHKKLAATLESESMLHHNIIMSMQEVIT